MAQSEAKTEIICLGEAMIDFLPVRSGQSLQQANQLRRMAGGATANVAVGLARQGAKVAFLGKVGDDPFGYFLRDTLATNGVDVSHLLLSKETNTGLTFAWTDPAANNEARYLFYRQRGADRLLRPDEIDENWLAQAKILQFGSLLLAAEPSAEAMLNAIACARRAGVLTCYDVNMRLPAWPDHATARAGMLSIVAECDIIKLNRHELAFLTGERDIKTGAARLWHSSLRLLVVTMDAEGCYYRSREVEAFLPGFAVKVVDTVGAGDGFMAALLVQLLASNSKAGSFEVVLEDKNRLAEICCYANAAGAFTTTRAGAIPALPTRRQINRFLIQNRKG